MLTQNERRELIAKIRELPSKLEAAVKGLSDRQLDTPYGEGKWTPRQVVHHLADSHMHAFIRFKLVLAEEKPAFKGYDQDYWASTVDATETPVELSLAILRGMQGRWAALMEALSESQWRRSGDHPTRGEMTLDDLLVLYSGHGEKHVGHIVGLRRAKGW